MSERNTKIANWVLCIIGIIGVYFAGYQRGVEVGQKQVMQVLIEGFTDGSLRFYEKPDRK